MKLIKVTYSCGHSKQLPDFEWKYRTKYRGTNEMMCGACSLKRARRTWGRSY